jgi:acyl-CoA synthetase (AMP-forming)/AMP-acid ligase II
VPLIFAGVPGAPTGLQVISQTQVIWQEQTLSYAQLCERAARTATSLQARGIGRGDRVGRLINNRPEWLEAFFATMIAGRVVVAFSTWGLSGRRDASRKARHEFR